MRKGIIIVVAIFAVIVIIILYSYIEVSNGPIQPLGRLSFVKIENPDMYPDHPHSQLLAEYAEERGSKCALVVHFAGSSNYRSYWQNTSDNGTNKSVYIIEASYIDTQGLGSVNLSQINKSDSLNLALHGVPAGRYKYLSDGVVYNSYDDLMTHVYTLARENGQNGSIPMVWHGSVRGDNPNLNPGCGLPLYFEILTNTYGIIPAYVYTVYGLIFPYLNDPFKNFELSNYKTLEQLYVQGELNFDYTDITTGQFQNKTNNITANITKNLPSFE
ncbi:hypothetical protein [Methanobacterium spitsbergense]|uniref:hypothetical protein n=1 Tax=Methanobacterium spitsbergense TaxID=2874285 RepID=UPI001CBFD1BF|nr:hypothetical protein [Methanobacterium spitsbergense]